ncbi:hypothetical protein C8R45DRAFT_955547 [Mycena sanguinolenta]|nr:hypothetical protein C8R45DRAFT_955547 [Mycena sanguinolenta]
MYHKTMGCGCLSRVYIFSARMIGPASLLVLKSSLLSMAESSCTISEPSRRSIQRGGACVFCRRRKMKCDGRKPVCGQCERADRTHECEYADNHGLSSADYLEEDIRQVEQRIYQLEHPEEEAAPGSVPATDTWWNSPEPPIDMAHNLVDSFLSYSSDWGFFLDIEKFRHDALLPLPIGHHSRPSPALLTIVYFIAITLSDSPALKEHERIFLSRALSSLPASLSGIHPRKAIHALQAEILLSNYFYASGRFLEGKYHATAAVSLAVGAVLFNPPATTLRPVIEENERIDACWATVILDKAWAVATGTPSNLQNSSELFEMPWPEENTVGSPSFTIAQFLDGREPRAGPLSPKALLAKAVILWEQANSLGVIWKTDMGMSQSDEFFTTFNSLHTRIVDLQHQMVAVEPAPQSPSMRRTVVVGRSIVHAAMIQLHGTFAQTSMESKYKSLSAATAILQLAADADLLGSSFICPIIFKIWAVACEVAVEEIHALQTRLAWTQDVATSAESSLVAHFAAALATMRRFGTWSLLSSSLSQFEQYRVI